MARGVLGPRTTVNQYRPLDVHYHIANTFKCYVFNVMFSRANLVESEDGKKTLLSATDAIQRRAIAKRLLTPLHSSMPVSRNKKVKHFWLPYDK